MGTLCPLAAGTWTVLSTRPIPKVSCGELWIWLPSPWALLQRCCQQRTRVPPSERGASSFRGQLEIPYSALHPEATGARMKGEHTSANWNKTSGGGESADSYIFPPTTPFAILHLRPKAAGESSGLERQLCLLQEAYLVRTAASGRIFLFTTPLPTFIVQHLPDFASPLRFYSLPL